MAAAPAFLDRLVARLVRAFAPERIVLFGSYAKGTQHQDSDVDLLVVADCGDDPVDPRRRARQLASDCFPPVDIVFATPEEVAKADVLASPFLLSILGSGKTLYEEQQAGDPGAEEHSGAEAGRTASKHP